MHPRLEEGQELTVATVAVLATAPVVGFVVATTEVTVIVAAGNLEEQMFCASRTARSGARNLYMPCEHTDS